MTRGASIKSEIPTVLHLGVVKAILNVSDRGPVETYAAVASGTKSYTRFFTLSHCLYHSAACSVSRLTVQEVFALPVKLFDPTGTFDDPPSFLAKRTVINTRCFASVGSGFLREISILGATSGYANEETDYRYRVHEARLQ